MRGKFSYLYTIVDVLSRKFIISALHDSESDVHASALVAEACAKEGVQRDELVLHSDNGGPMRGSTMLATLQSLGVAASFSRLGVSDDNHYVESLFRTLKYRPNYHSRAFASIEAAGIWVERFTRWYNREHLHSAIGFVTPNQRHCGLDAAMLRKRSAVYEAARRRRPERWPGNCRYWARVLKVRLNPRDNRTPEAAA